MRFLFHPENLRLIEIKMIIIFLGDIYFLVFLPIIRIFEIKPLVPRTSNLSELTVDPDQLSTEK